jgi:hypothetical protein
VVSLHHALFLSPPRFSEGKIIFLNVPHDADACSPCSPGFSPAAPAMTYAYPTTEMQQYASLMAMQQQASSAFQQTAPGAMRQYSSHLLPSIIFKHRIVFV